jgi:hypothetical protein
MPRCLRLAAERGEFETVLQSCKAREIILFVHKCDELRYSTIFASRIEFDRVFVLGKDVGCEHICRAGRSRRQRREATILLLELTDHLRDNTLLEFTLEDTEVVAGPFYMVYLVADELVALCKISMADGSVTNGSVTDRSMTQAVGIVEEETGLRENTATGSTLRKDVN